MQNLVRINVCKFIYIVHYMHHTFQVIYIHVFLLRFPMPSLCLPSNLTPQLYMILLFKGINPPGRFMATHVSSARPCTCVLVYAVYGGNICSLIANYLKESL